MRSRSLMQRDLRVRFQNGPAVNNGPDVPSAPINLTANDAGGGNYDLDWDESFTDGGDAITTYHIYKNGVEIDTVAAPTTEYLGVAAIEGDEFYVTAENGIGESSPSNTATIPSDPVVLQGMLGPMVGSMLGPMLGRGI